MTGVCGRTDVGAWGSRPVLVPVPAAAVHNEEVVPGDGSEDGAAALREGRWDDARRIFGTTIETDETAEAHLGIAEAYWWLCDARAASVTESAAYSLLRQRDDAIGAGRVAIDLCIAHLVNLGNDAAANGWLARAERVLRHADPNPLQGWLWLMQGFVAPDAQTGHALFALRPRVRPVHG